MNQGKLVNNCFYRMFRFIFSGCVKTWKVSGKNGVMVKTFQVYEVW